MIAWILMVLGLFFAFSALTYLIYWYDTANGPAKEDLIRLSKGRPCFWIFRGIVSGALAQALLVLTYPMGWFRRNRLPESSEDGPIVVFVHGLYHNPSAWWAFRWAFRRSGFPDAFLWHYPSRGISFSEIVAKLRSALMHLHRAHPGRPLILVGHSLGGLLLRAVLPTLGDLPTAAVVTLGSPHQGSRLAVFALGRLGRSLGYRSALIDAVERNESPPAVPCLAVRSPVDNMVLPLEASVPRTSGWEILWTPPVSHVALLYHPTVIFRTIRWIKENIRQFQDTEG